MPETQSNINVNLIIFRLFVSTIIGALIGVSAYSIGNNWHIIPVSIIILFSLSSFIEYHKIHADDSWLTLIKKTRSYPRGIQLLTITFLVTSLFALEMKIDLIPDQYGFLELLMPIILSQIFIGSVGSLYTLILIDLFAYYVFVPPRFSLIFEPGPTFDSLMAFSLLSITIMIWLYYSLPHLIYQSNITTFEKVFHKLKITHHRCVLFFKNRDVWYPLILTIAYTLFWTLYGTISAGNGLHVDSLEAYAWGREFQLGYFKHPPFWSWVAGLWFLIFPKYDFFFYLLSELNAALGLLGVWALLGRFCSGVTRKLALIILLLTPFYQFNALRFNANTIQLSLWAWTLYFFVCSIETRKIIPTISFGVLTGFALLSKYYAFILIASCFIAATIHDNRRQYFRSYVPYLSALISFTIFLPHLLWLFKDGFKPLLYLLERTDYPDQTISGYYFEYIGAYILFFSIPIILLFASKYIKNSNSMRSIDLSNGVSFITTLAFAPTIFTLIAGSIGHVSLTPPDGISSFCLVPLILIILIKPDLNYSYELIKKSVLTLMIFMIGASPFIPYLSIRYLDKGHDLPRREIVDDALNIWKAETKAPLRFATGTDPYNLSLVFRSKNNTSEFRGFNFNWSPWVQPKQLYKHGLLIICLKADEKCLDHSRIYMTADTKIFEKTKSRSVWGYVGQPREFVIFVIPPHPQN